MKKPELYVQKGGKRLELLIYLLPAIGLVPALWKLYRKKSDREEKSVCRLSVNLGLIWIVSYTLLWLGAAQTSEFVTFRLLYLNALLSSGYFLVCIVLMVRILQGKSINKLGTKQKDREVSRKNML